MLKIKINVWGPSEVSRKVGTKGWKAKVIPWFGLKQTYQNLSICCQIHPHPKGSCSFGIRLTLQRIFHGHDPPLKTHITSERAGTCLKSQGCFRPSLNNQISWYSGNFPCSCLLSPWRYVRLQGILKKGLTSHEAGAFRAPTISAPGFPIVQTDLMESQC